MGRNGNTLPISSSHKPVLGFHLSCHLNVAKPGVCVRQETGNGRNGERARERERVNIKLKLSCLMFSSLCSAL